jgi:gentisate 1,2-dioxygenase
MITVSALTSDHTGPVPGAQRSAAEHRDSDAPDLMNHAAATPEEQEKLDAMYARMGELNLIPLWTQRENLMPDVPAPAATANRWDWQELIGIAQTAGDLVPVGRGGERRAIALANPGLSGNAFIAPTLCAAIQYLGPGETAPEHRHSQNAFRFVIEGEGVWTVVNGDPVAMRRGDFLVTAGWNFHGHHNDSGKPMAWLDGLDIPFQQQMDTAFFEEGTERVTDEATPDLSRGERLWCHPGLRPLAFPGAQSSSPIPCYRWEHTDAALDDQLALEDEGFAGTVSPGHAAIRFTNPTTGGDVMTTLRTEFHRLRPGASTTPVHEVGNRVLQVFEGTATVTVADQTFTVSTGDVVNVPSWQAWSVATDEGVDLFSFTDAPIFEALHLYRTYQQKGI